MTWVSLKSHSSAIGPSPIALMIQDERINRVLVRLADQLDALRAAETQGHNAPLLLLSREEMAYVRETWERHVLEGEQRLYTFATMLAIALTGTPRLQRVARVVAGPKEEYETGESRIVIEEFLSRERLEKSTDYGLAESIVNRYRYRQNETDPFGSIYARASFLEFRPLEMGEDFSATRVMTRVKANDSMWNKVCDALFDIDNVVARHKILNAKTKYVKDVFGIKILTTHAEQSYLVEELLEAMCFEPELLAEFNVPPSANSMELIERKDYLSAATKQTGWKAIKNVYRFGQHFFEIQIQTEANYFAEISDLSSTSHRTFDMQRRHLRWALEKQLPHYREFRHLLRGIFDPSGDQSLLEELDVNLDWVRLTA